MRPPTRLPLQLLLSLSRRRPTTPPPWARRSLATHPSLLDARSAASRNVLARYAPGAAPIKSTSDVPLTTLFGGETGAPAAAGTKNGDPTPSLLPPSPPQRPMVMLEDVLTPAAPPAGAGPMTVAGVEVPAKPERPGDEECCMSGCAICIYDIYADALLEYNTALRAARKALLAADSPETVWPGAVREMHRKLAAREERAARRNAAAAQAEQAANAVVAEAAAEEMDETLEDLDPAMRAFLELEGKLKKAKQVAEAGG